PLDDSEVQIVWKTSYSGFGEVLSKVGQLDQNPIFAGKEYDEDLELYYVNADGMTLQQGDLSVKTQSKMGSIGMCIA
ncbi:MAG: hypothetical protein MI749_08710, partial [Desulfovibrionales bacterium]|nr:hypothetical protein [Desulfovibrionales bacterium]